MFKTPRRYDFMQFVLRNSEGNFYGKRGKSTSKLSNAVMFQKRKEARDRVSSEFKKTGIKWEIRQV